MKYSVAVSGIFALLTPPVAISATNSFLRSLQRTPLEIQKCLKKYSNTALHKATHLWKSNCRMNHHITVKLNSFKYKMLNFQKLLSVAFLFYALLNWCATGCH